MGPSLDRSESDGRRIDDFEREHRLTNVPNLRLGEEVLAGRRLEDLVIDDEDDHLQQERQPADGRGRAGAVRLAPFRGRRGRRGHRNAAGVRPISRDREDDSAGFVGLRDPVFPINTVAPRRKIDANALRARGVWVGVWAQVVRILFQGAAGALESSVNLVARVVLRRFQSLRDRALSLV